MHDRIFALLLSLSLTFQNGCTGFQVWTFLQYNFKDNNSVNIICQHNASEGWTMVATVLTNDKNVCKNDQSNAVCDGRIEGNQFKFTLNITDENKRFLYRCMVYKTAPLPIQWRHGEEISLLPGCDISPTNSCNSSEVGNDCSYAAVLSVLFWALLGIVVLLFLYSVIITAVYVTLRRKFSEELTVTYVPMQQNKVRPKKTRMDKNAEYMDMREVHHHTQPIKDMNHNSRMNPVGFTV